MSAEYWNHNTAYHPWLLSIASHHRGDVLDVGCGDGLLAQRLASTCRSVTAIDPDPAAVQRAQLRLSAHANVTVSHADFGSFDPGTSRFDLIAFVASLHHMELRPALTRARELLTPTGQIAVVGLSANKTPLDYAVAALCLPVTLLSSKLHSETPDIGVVTAEPRESLGEIRRTIRDVLPGAKVRRALHYRYLLRWQNG